MSALLSRNTCLTAGPVAWADRRLRAAREGEHGLRVVTLPQLASLLAGGFIEPATRSDIAEAAMQALTTPQPLRELGRLVGLPGLPGAVAAAIGKAWALDISLDATHSPRLHDLALLSDRIAAGLPAHVRPPREIVAAAVDNMAAASRLLGRLDIEGLIGVDPVWRPLLAALVNAIPCRWRIAAGVAADLDWFTRAGGSVEVVPAAAPQVGHARCADPAHEALEAVRWARALMVEEGVAPGDIAIVAADPARYDDRMAVLADTAGLPLHFVHGRPALDRPVGQALAALADVLSSGLSRERVVRLLHRCGQGAIARHLPQGWWKLPMDGALGDVASWRRVFGGWSGVPAADIEALTALIDRLHQCHAQTPANDEAAALGDLLLDPQGRALWRRLLARAPVSAVERSLGGLRLSDGVDAARAVAWCSADQYGGASRPHVRMLGVNAGLWPRGGSDDALLPDHLLPEEAPRLVPRPLADNDRFKAIAAGARRLVVSFATLDGDRRLFPSHLAGHPDTLKTVPQLAPSQPAAHAATEADRRLSRRAEFRQTQRGAAALACWSNWHRTALTGHDGLLCEAAMAVVRERLQRPVSATTSLERLLAAPLAFVWRDVLNWRQPELPEAGQMLDARTMGVLVHEILEDTAAALAARGQSMAEGLNEVVRAEIAAATEAVTARWQTTRPVPPPVMWHHTIARARQLAANAVENSAAPAAEPPASWSSWAELRFGGQSVPAAEAGPPARQPPGWDADKTVPYGSDGDFALTLRGAIDRLDLSADGARIVDYKTGTSAELMKGRTNVQLAVYAAAVEAVLGIPAATVPGTLVAPVLNKSKDYAAAANLQALADLWSTRRDSLARGLCPPAPAPGYVDYAFLLPAASQLYFSIKGSALDESGVDAMSGESSDDQ